MIRQSFQDGYLMQGKAWMGMIDSRNLSTHTYDESTAEELTSKIKSLYYYLFKDLIIKLEEETRNKLDEGQSLAYNLTDIPAFTIPL